jgi:3-phytase
VYDSKISMKGTLGLGGISEFEIKGGLSILQSSADGYPSGAVALAFEGEDNEGVAVGSLEGALAASGIKPNQEVL